MNRLVLADIHAGTDGLAPELVRVLERTQDRQRILCGDTCNFLPLGWLSFARCRTLDQLDRLLTDEDIIIAGNHDPKQYWLRLWNRPGMIHDFYQSGGWFFSHGHERSDWALWGRLAPQVVRWAVQYHPEAWYRLCRALGWLPGTEKTHRGETQRYTLLTQATHAAWQRWGEQVQQHVCIGHTHKALVSYGQRRDGNGRLWMCNPGDVLSDRTALEISARGAEIRYL